jgi:hypothetical protein
MRHFGATLSWAMIALFSVPQAAQAQPAPGIASGFNPADGVAGDRRVSAEWMAYGATLRFRSMAAQARNCFDTGCIAIVNDTDGYDAVAMYLDTGTPDPNDAPIWGPNELRSQLRPHRAVWTYSSGDPSMCEVGVKVVLRNRRNKADEMEILGTVRLCKSPGTDALLRIRVNSPRVSIGDSAIAP